MGAIEAGPPTGSAATGPSLLGGLPEGYVSPADFTNLSHVADRAEQGVGVRPGQPARYREGAQYAYINAGPETIWRMQRRLYGAGLLTDQDVVTRGVWQGATVDAYEYLLGYANASGMSDLEALSEFERNPIPADPSRGRTRQPLVRHVTNDDDLRAVFRNASREALGYGELPDDQVESMIRAYHQQEIAAQEAAYAADATGGTVSDPPSVQTFAEQQLRQFDPVAFDANKYVDAFQVLADMLGGKR